MKRDALMELAKSKDVTGADSRVLLAIFGLAGSDNRVTVTPSGLAEYLRISPQQVEHSLKRLQNSGWIFAEKTAGTAGSYLLNPAQGQQVTVE